MIGNPSHIAMVLDNPFESDMRVEKEIESLLRAGFKLTLFCQKKKGLADDEVAGNGLRIIRSFDNFFQHPLRQGYKQRVNSIANQIIETKPAAIHCHDFFTLEIGARVKELQPETILVYDTHEYFLKWAFYQDIPGFFNRFKGWLNWKYLIHRERTNCKKVDLLISTTNAICERIVANYQVSAPTLALRNIPNIAASNEPGRDLRTKLSIDSHIRILVQSGNIYQTDDQLHQMFNAVCDTEKLVFVIIGNRPRYYEVRQWVEQAPKYKSKILFVEYDTKYLFDYLTSADIGVLFMKTDVWESHKITSPNRVMEYSLCGIPFISVDQVTSLELKKEFGHVEIYDLNTADSFYETLNKMLSNLSAYTQKAKAVHGQLSWEKEFSPILDFYSSLENS